MSVAEWVVVEHHGEYERLLGHPTVRLADAERQADAGELRQVKQVSYKMGGCKDSYGYYLAIGTTDGEHYKVREV